VELQKTSRLALRVTWEILWRWFVSAFVVGVVAGVVGYLIIRNPDAMDIFVIAASLMVTPLVLYYAVWCVLGRRFGRFRLVLLSSEAAGPRSSGEKAE
jgi:hypothetical protein